jgi:4-alpha-glucanotransferase
MAPLQDLLNLGSEARMNVPGRAGGNWRWPFTEDMVSDQAFEWVRGFTKSSNRFGTIATPSRVKVLEALSP